jgi:hypothetical protein
MVDLVSCCGAPAAVRDDRGEGDSRALPHCGHARRNSPSARSRDRTGATCSSTTRCAVIADGRPAELGHANVCVAACSSSRSARPSAPSAAGRRGRSPSRPRTSTRQVRSSTDSRACQPSPSSPSAGSDQYDMVKIRFPSWCDRIQWQGQDVTQLCYRRAELLCSDHRPVLSVFDITVRTLQPERRNIVYKVTGHPPGSRADPRARRRAFSSAWTTWRTWPFRGCVPAVCWGWWAAKSPPAVQVSLSRNTIPFSQVFFDTCVASARARRGGWAGLTACVQARDGGVHRAQYV